jgi:preprotein translocase subunit SecF
MSFLRRLYRGETNLDFVGNRKRWYLASAVIIVICLASMIFRHFNFGVEFAGGDDFLMPVKPGTTVSEVRSAVERTGVDVSSATVKGSGGDAKYDVRTPKLSDDQRNEVRAALVSVGNVTASEISTSEVSSSWGKAVTRQALIGLIVFLVVVSVYIWIRFEQRMAIAAIAALIHDLILTAGVYSLIGFEVTPGTVVGLLTILGFSLYDTVVVFDKVDENSKALLGQVRQTYPEAANLAVNQTLMRSINTSLIGLLPVAGLLFVGAGILGVGTLKDLALVLFVGMLTGAYSSLFLATPWLVDLKLLDPRYKMQMQRVLTRRAGGGTEPRRAAAKKVPAKPAPAKVAASKAAAKGAAVKPGRPRPSPAKPTIDEPDVDAVEVDEDDLQTRIDALAGTPAPAATPRPTKRTGGRPPQRKRPSGKRR